VLNEVAAVWCCLPSTPPNAVPTKLRGEARGKGGVGDVSRHGGRQEVAEQEGGERNAGKKVALRFPRRQVQGPRCRRSLKGIVHCNNSGRMKLMTPKSTVNKTHPTRQIICHQGMQALRRETFLCPHDILQSGRIIVYVGKFFSGEGMCPHF